MQLNIHIILRILNNRILNNSKKEQNIYRKKAIPKTYADKKYELYERINLNPSFINKFHTTGWTWIIYAPKVAGVILLINLKKYLLVTLIFENKTTKQTEEYNIGKDVYLISKYSSNKSNVILELYLIKNLKIKEKAIDTTK